MAKSKMSNLLLLGLGVFALSRMGTAKTNGAGTYTAGLGETATVVGQGGAISAAIAVQQLTSTTQTTKALTQTTNAAVKASKSTSKAVSTPKLYTGATVKGSSYSKGSITYARTPSGALKRVA